jgi:hypothetical protein
VIREASPMREAPFVKRISFWIRTPRVSRFTGFKSDCFNNLLASESASLAPFRSLKQHGRVPPSFRPSY